MDNTPLLEDLQYFVGSLVNINNINLMGTYKSEEDLFIKNVMIWQQLV